MMALGSGATSRGLLDLDNDGLAVLGLLLPAKDLVPLEEDQVL